MPEGEMMETNSPCAYRSLFDYASYEWKEMDLKTKVEILKSYVHNGESIKRLALEMMEYCHKNENKDIKPIDMVLAMSEILEFCMREKNI